MGHNEVDGNPVPKSNTDEKLASTIDLYIGIFFDGTNNNKYQVMLGKMFRRKEIFENAKKRLEEKLNDYLTIHDFILFNNKYPLIKDIFHIPNRPKRELWETSCSVGIYSEGELNFIYGRDGKKIRSIDDVLLLSRNEIETNYSGVFTKSELEYLYFGYGDTNDTNEAKFDTFVEKKSGNTLAGKDLNQQSTNSNDITIRSTLQRVANNTVNQDDARNLENLKGAAAQNATYTNVAILESLYKCENKENDKGEINERHISVYVEGSGADMQFEASTSKAYKATIGLAGLGLGTGPTGVVSKIRKASSMVNQLYNQYKCIKDVKVNFHFDLFGFSRGSTCARIMAYLINADPDTNKAFNGNGRINNDDYLLLTSIGKEFLPIDEQFKEKEIRFMGIFDTVSSIGIKNKEIATLLLANLLERNIHAAKNNKKTDIHTIWNHIKPNILPACKYLGSFLDSTNTIGDSIGEYFGNYFTLKSTEIIDPIVEEIDNYVQSNDYRDSGTEDIAVIPEGKSLLHKDNVKDYGLWATSLAKDTVHICAMDEVRQNFALVDIQSSLDKGTGKEIFIPGCHTDIGGGASIGMEGEKIINKGSKRYLTSYYVHSKSWLEKDEGNLIMPINVDSMKELGWLNQDSKTSKPLHFSVTGRFNLDEDETYYCDNIMPSNIIMYRHVTPGYSNVSLNYMKEKAVKGSFSAVPTAYQVPNDLNDLYKQLVTINSSGRYFVYPNKQGQYTELRRRYIHFSLNEQILDIADNLLVNPPEFTEIENKTKGKIQVISRIIYPGTMTDSIQKHMFDYE